MQGEGGRVTPGLSRAAWEEGTSLCGVTDKLPQRELIWDLECGGWEVSGGCLLRSSWSLLEGGWSLL